MYFGTVVTDIISSVRYYIVTSGIIPSVTGFIYFNWSFCYYSNYFIVLHPGVLQELFFRGLERLLQFAFGSRRRLRPTGRGRAPSDYSPKTGVAPPSDCGQKTGVAPPGDCGRVTGVAPPAIVVRRPGSHPLAIAVV